MPIVLHDTTREFNMDWKAECGQLCLAHVNRNKGFIRNMGRSPTCGHLAPQVRLEIQNLKGVAVARDNFEEATPLKGQVVSRKSPLG